MSELEHVEARWRAGRIRSGELPGVAERLLASGFDVPALRQLAAIPADAADELRSDGRLAFERALRELGVGGMSGSDAALVLAREWCEQLLGGTLAPRRTAKAIARLRWTGGPRVDQALDPFEALDAEYEAVERRGIGALFARRRIDRAVRDAARRLLGR